MPANTPYISIVICTHNREKSLGNFCLPALTTLTYKNFEVVVVLDACTDDTMKIVNSYNDKFSLRIINNPKSKGISYARNLGIAKAEGEIVAFIDDDCVVSPDWLEGVVNFFVLNPNAAAMLGRTENRTGEETIQEFGGSGNMAIRGAILKRIRFDESINYFGCTRGEDIDFMSRMKKHRFVFENVEQAKLVHLTQPAAYRKLISLSNFVNGSYLDCKRRSAVRYYFFLFMGIYTAVFFHSKYNQITARLVRGEYLKDMVFRFPYYLSKNLVRDKNIIDSIKLVYFIFFDIPVRAAIKRCFEEFYFRTGF